MDPYVQLMLIPLVKLRAISQASVRHYLLKTSSNDNPLWVFMYAHYGITPNVTWSGKVATIEKAQYDDAF
jgi:hypothetical protein